MNVEQEAWRIESASHSCQAQTFQKQDIQALVQLLILLDDAQQLGLSAEVRNRLASWDFVLNSRHAAC
jgi:hypothetical protein